MAAIIAQGRPGATSGTCPVRLAFLRRTPGGTLSVPQHARTDQGHQDLDAACPRGLRPFHGAPVLGVDRGFFHLQASSPRSSAFVDYCGLIVMRLTFSCAFADFGRVTVRTPFLNDALTLSSSTSSTGIRRSNRP